MIKTNYPEYVINERPALVRVGKISIKIDEDNNIEIEGHNDLNFNCAGDLNINAKKINMTGEDDMVIESKTHLVQMAPRIDLNPHHAAPSYEDRIEHIENMDHHHVS
jgi:hypothetical protein